MAEQPDIKRPEHGTLSIWKDLQTGLSFVKDIEFLLGFEPAKPQQDGQFTIDLDAIQCKLTDLRGILGTLALAMTERDA